MSHVFRFALSDRPGVEFTLIDADSRDADEARVVLDWQFGGRVVDVREASESEAPDASMGIKQ
jgi:hypothetical protein